MAAVAAFWQTPVQELATVAQETFRLDVFKGLGPTVKRTISFCPS
jgi:hypothetical protein